MSKIVLDNVESGFNLQKINSNFQKIEDELNTKVLYRVNPAGEPNSLENAIDFNNQDILNVKSFSLNGATLESIVADAQAAADIATAEAAIATTQAGIATTQAGLAASSAGAANTSATAASTSASSASTSASTATTKAAEAVVSAASAAINEANANNSAYTAFAESSTAGVHAANAANSESGAGTALTAAIAAKTAAAASAASAGAAEIVYVIDNGGVAINAGIKGELQVPFNCTINTVTLIGDVTGTVAVTVSKSDYSTFPTVTSISTPSITTAQKSQLTSLSISLTAGDILQFSVTGTTTAITRVSVNLKVARV